MIGKRAAEHGTVAAVQHYIKVFPDLMVNTVRHWRDVYRVELKKRAREVNEGGIKTSELPEKKKGHPLLLGKELDKEVQAYITTCSLRESGAVKNKAITINGLC